MQAHMQTSFNTSDQAAQVITMQHHRSVEPVLAAFNSNNDHLQALEQEAKLMVAVATLRNNTTTLEDENEREPGFPFLPVGASLPQTEALLETMASENRSREVLSRKAGVRLNFIEFCDTWELDSVERKIIMLLLMQFSSPIFFAIFRASKLELNCDNGMEIGVLLSIISENLGEQLVNRRYFNIHGSLLGKELLTANHNCIDSTTSILRMSVYLHERFVRHILGDENQYHVAFRFIRQERSNVSLAQVVLPEAVKLDVINHAEKYFKGRKNGDLDQIDAFFGYGTGMTFLFHGPSGTGKTMLAKGIANHLSCPLVSLNMEDLQKIPLSNEDILAMLFREAALLGGIVFLDECDDVFGRDDIRLSRSLLLEIEKSRCMTILATNKPLELDPAMERRLNMKVQIELPDAALRLQMWQALLPPDVRLSPDVDLKVLADRFPFTGGLIKNSILMAMTLSLTQDSKGKVLSHSNLEHAATLQTATFSDIHRICEKLPPMKSLEEAPLGRQQRDQLRGLARAWDWLHREEMGLNLLFNCNDITTGIKAAFGLAAEIGIDVHAYDIAKVSSLAEDEKVLDMVTQRRIAPMTAAFINNATGRTLTLFIDYLGDISQLINTEFEKTTNIIYGEMFHQLRKNKGLFCLVTKGLKTGSIPVEFHQMITLSYPPEELQMRHWEQNLGCGSLSDDELVDLVERYPMHLSEIDFMSRQAKVRAIISGRDHTSIVDVTEVISTCRGIKQPKILFGGKPVSA
jgi:hypothetical protein